MVQVKPNTMLIGVPGAVTTQDAITMDNNLTTTE
jgi:hypothetical protein